MRLALGFGGLSLLLFGWACSVYDESLLTDTTGGGGQGGQGVTTTTTGMMMCQSPSDCLGEDTQCRTRTCEGGMCGVLNVPAGTLLTDQVPGDCLEQQCDGNGESTVVPQNTDIPEDGKECTVDACNGGVASNTAKAPGAACNTTDHCNAASECVECVIDANCASNVCNMRTFVCADAMCGDGAENGDETDLDCGGSCPPCATGLDCMDNLDCESDSCVIGVCVASCTDDEQNNGETDIDCGGPNCPNCTFGQGCNDDSDCEGGVCPGGTCTCTGTHLVLSEIRTRGLGGGNDEFMEIYNPTNAAVVLDATWSIEARSHTALNYGLRWAGTGQTIPPLGHLLVVGTAYTPPPAGDGTLDIGTTDASSVRLVQSGTTIDAVCFYTTTGELDALTLGTHECEGTPVLRGVANADISIQRLPGSSLGNCTDTESNVDDWTLTTPSLPQSTVSPTTP